MAARKSRTASKTPRTSAAQKPTQRTSAASRKNTSTASVTYAQLGRTLGPQIAASRVQAGTNSRARLTWRRAQTQKRFVGLVKGGARVFCASTGKIAQVCSKSARTSTLVAQALRKRFGSGIKAVASDRDGNWIVAAKL